MKLGLYSICLILVSFSVAFAATTVDTFTDDDFFRFFEQIRLRDDCLYLNRGNEDITLKAEEDGKSVPDSAPGSLLKLPTNAGCRLFDQEMSLWITPAYRNLGLQHIWLLEEMNRRGDVHVCLLKHRRNLEAFPKPEDGFELEPVAAVDVTSLRKLEIKCVGREVVPKLEGER